MNHYKQFVQLCEQGTLAQVQEYYYLNAFMKYNISYVEAINRAIKYDNHLVAKWLQSLTP